MHGTFMVNVPANIFSGPALVEAYRLGEEGQLLGITVDDVVGDTVKLMGRLPWRPGGLSSKMPRAYEWLVRHAAAKGYLKGGKLVGFFG